MEIKLLGSLDYKKVKDLLDRNIESEEQRELLLDEIKKLERRRRSEIVSSAGRLSRASGTVMDIVNLSEEKEESQNINFASRVIGMGHSSISDHDYCVFALKDVSPVVEQTIIEERFSSFTIKSRREVDFSKVGFYIPEFHDEKGAISEDNAKLKEIYINHMQHLFDKYKQLIELGIPKEDARFVLPYCYHSNIIMGVDAHTLKDMIIKLTKTKDANITELKELGEKLYDIAKENIPYIIPEIDKVETIQTDSVDEYLSTIIEKEKYSTAEGVQLLNDKTVNIDDSILISAIMRRYQYTKEQATDVYKELCNNDPNFKNELMKKIAFSSDGKELTQISLQFSIPLTLAVLTHLTRHRTHHILPPDFVPNIDLEQYKTPPSIKKNKQAQEIFEDVFKTNVEVYKTFKDFGIREEDLVYFSLSGNTVNSITNMDGKTIKHILGLRECTKSQWETRQMANGIHNIIRNIDGADAYEQILGPTCVTQGICNEGKECCGKIYTLKNKHTS